MRLTGVTITGADDSTDRAEFHKLTEEYAFLEWGILLSIDREGTARYPSSKTVTELLVGLPSSRASLHLCGSVAAGALAGHKMHGISGLRYQVNGFSKFVAEHGSLTMFGEFIMACRAHGTEVILQVADEKALSVALLLRSIHRNVSALWDESGGRGVTSPEWPEPPPGLVLGYAGGINPENVGRIAEKLIAHPSPAETWIDMESGVRTNDKLDFDKVRAVLEQVSPFVHREVKVLS